MSANDLALIYNKRFVDTVTRNFKEFLDTDLYIDLIFVCRNNVKIGAHQMVMSCMSKFFYEMFVENSRTVKEKVLHIYVPDIRSKIMKHILEFVYCGKARLSKTELPEFNEDIKLLGMPLDVFTNGVGSSVGNTTDNAADPKANTSNTTITAPIASPINHSTSSLSSATVSPKLSNSATFTPVESPHHTTPSPVPKATSCATPVLPETSVNDPFESLKNFQSESIVSSSNTSVLIPPDLTVPMTVPSPSKIFSQTKMSDLPVIVNTQSLSSDCTSDMRPPNLAENDTVYTNGDMNAVPGSTSSISNQKHTNSDDGPSRRKRRKQCDAVASAVISLDSDDDDENGVITLS